LEHKNIIVDPSDVIILPNFRSRHEKIDSVCENEKEVQKKTIFPLAFD